MAEDKENPNNLPVRKVEPDWNKPIEVKADEGMHRLSIYFDWSQETIGFGQLSITKNKDGTVTCMNENMNKEWCRRALYSAIDAALDKATFE